MDFSNRIEELKREWVSEPNSTFGLKPWVEGYLTLTIKVLHEFFEKISERLDGLEKKTETTITVEQYEELKRSIAAVDQSVYAIEQHHGMKNTHRP